MIGETMFVSGLAMFLSAPLAGFLASRLDSRLMMGIGFAGFAYGTWMVTGLTAEWGFPELFWPQILRGILIMFCMVPINNIGLGTLPPKRLKNASGLFNLMRNLRGLSGLLSSIQLFCAAAIFIMHVLLNQFTRGAEKFMI